LGDGDAQLKRRKAKSERKKKSGARREGVVEVVVQTSGVDKVERPWEAKRLVAGIEGEE